jgi:regulator of protease activity HflC (stomatin/prohibitin superfamily)
LGKFHAVRGPGVIVVIPVIDRMYRVDTRMITVERSLQDMVTTDNVILIVHAVICFHVASPKDAIVNTEDFYTATCHQADMVLRDVLGHSTFTELRAPRDTVNHRVRSTLDAEVHPWGITVDSVEIKHVAHT